MPLREIHVLYIVKDFHDINETAWINYSCRLKYFK
jgi:hypothetical protein